MLKKANSDLVRRQNRGLVLETLRQRGPLARITLGHQTGLSPASITSISGQLIDEGLVYSIVEDEDVPAEVKRGRPQTRLALNPQATNILAISISVDGVELIFADFSGATREPIRLRLDSYEMPKEDFGPRVALEIKANAKKATMKPDAAVALANRVLALAELSKIITKGENDAKKKEWAGYNARMEKAAEELLKAAKAKKTGPELAKAFTAVNAACTTCHSAFKGE